MVSAEWLKSLKQGDAVAIYRQPGFGGSRVTCSYVAKVTGAWIIMEDGEKFHRENGKRTNVNRPADIYIHSSWKEAQETLDRMSLQQKLYKLKSVYDMPIEKVRKLLALLKEAE